MAVVAASALVAVSGCAKGDDIPMIIEDPWVRTTEGATDPSMTALFFSAVNPGEKPNTLTKADCSSVAGKTEIHEMVKGDDGKMVMQEDKDGLEIAPGTHEHLKPGGHHVMLMMLKKPLAIGDEVTCTLTFSTGDPITVTAPVKKFTEEEDHYHPSPAANG